MLRRIQDELRSLPGIVAASGADVALMTGSSFGNTLRILGYEPKEGESTNAAFNSVAPGFFETLGIPLVAGRDLAESDVDGAPKVAVVNEVFARRFFKAESPLGRRFGMGRRSTSFDYEIVGVVRDGKSSSMREEPKPFVYVPFMQDDTVGRPHLLCPLEREARVVRRGAARGGGPRRSRAPGHRPQDDARPDRRVALRRAHGGGALGGLRLPRHAARRDRPLRSDELRGRRAHARDRPPRRPRRRPPHGAGDGPEGRRAARPPSASRSACPAASGSAG